MSLLAFEPNTASGMIELRTPEGSRNGRIPSWLLDDLQVLEALLILAKAGGIAAMNRAPDFHDAYVDTALGTVTYQEVEI